MASQEELDRRLAEELHKEELRLLIVSNQSMANDVEEDRLLAERLQREEEAEYTEFIKTPNSFPALELPSDTKDFKINLPSTSRDNKYQKLQAEHKDLSLVDPVWEQIDPTPDIHAMFIAFDNRFFAGFLKSCEVRWSPRMTLCAGLCCFQPKSRFCSIRLSKPLLSLRPRSDLVETLLHEMIHAFLFLTNNNRDRDGHGPEFHKHMWRINKEAGTKISVYHSFHDEVRHFKVHHWRCNGPCQNRPPYFGWVKRSMNRAPAKTDFWWEDHQRTCGGQYIKVSGPEKQTKEPKREQSQNGTDAPRAPSPLRKFFKPDATSTPLSQPGSSGSAASAAGGTKMESGGTKLGSTGNSSSAGQSTSGIGKPGSTKRPEHQPSITSWLPKPSTETTSPDLDNGRVSGLGGGRTQTPRGRVTTPPERARGRKSSSPAASGGGFGSGSSSAYPQPRPSISGQPRMRGRGGFGSGSSGATPQPGPNIGGLPRMRGRGGFGSGSSGATSQPGPNIGGSPTMRGRGGFGNGGSGAAPQPRPNIGGLPRMRGGAGFGSRVVTIKGPVRNDHVLPTSQTNAVDSIFSPSVRAGDRSRVFRPFQGTGNVLGSSASVRQPRSSQNPNFRPQSSLLAMFSNPVNTTSSTSTSVDPPAPRRRTPKQLLDIFSSDEDEHLTDSDQTRWPPKVETKVTEEKKPVVETEVKLKKEEEKTPKVEIKVTEETKSSVQIEVKLKKDEKNPLKREFEDEASTSQRPPKSVKREARDGASTSRQVPRDQEVIVIPPNDVEVVCPVCSSKVLEFRINSHIDECLK